MPSQKTTRIAKNTVALYIRMAVMMLIGLYTSRVVLNVLGVSDYGVYNVVGGVVGMFAILTNSLSSSISRYLTFELGRENHERLCKVFSMSINVQLVMAVVIVLLTEIVGIWFLNTKMNIPEGRMNAANWVFQCALISFVVGLLMVPYNASIIAHERMNIYAYISIWDAVMKLAIVFALYISPFDKLKSYAVLLLAVSLMTTCIYWIYCRLHFEECRYHYVKDISLLKEMTKFAGWAFLGDGSYILNTQGINILINIFFGVTLNAARGIATTVDGAVQSFVRNFTTALNPQITKSYASGDLHYMHQLICFGAKYSYFMMLIFVVPICLETRQILTLWLKIVPDYAVVFVQLTLMTSMCIVLGGTLTTAISATGKIRNYEIVVGLMALSNFPLTWLVFFLGFSPVSAYVVCFIVYFLMAIVKLYLVKDYIQMPSSLYMNNVMLRVLFTTALAVSLPFLLCIFQEDSLSRLLEVVFVSLICSLVSIYGVGMNTQERVFVRNLIRK